VSEANRSGTGYVPRPERFYAPAIFEPYEKPCGRGNIPRPALGDSIDFIISGLILLTHK